jgi:tRNA threonylcarbamoyladenosine biosynthesis protein TsaB
MHVLAVDTALGACSAAVIADGVVIGRTWEPMQRGHAERLADLTRETLDLSGADFGRMDRLAVTVGPGTFTGLRVGLSFIRAMAVARAIPAVGVTTLTAIAAGARRENKSVSPIGVVIDARRGQFYFQLFQGDLTEITSPQILDAARAIDQIVECEDAHGRLTLGGSGVELLGKLPSRVETAGVVQPDATDVGLFASTVSNPLDHQPDPLYLRAPDAKAQTLSVFASRRMK